MIGKVIIGKGFSGCIRYCLEDKRPDKGQVIFANRSELLWQNQCFGNAKELARDFREVARLSSRTEKPVLHLVLNPAQSDRLTNGQWIEIAEACTREFDVADHQYICILHKDRGTPHLHIVANRVGYDGKAASDSNSYKRMQDFCRKLEKQYGLQQILSSKAFLPADQKHLPRKDRRKLKLQSDIRNLLQKVRSFQEFKIGMQGLGYQVIKGRGISFVDSKGVRTKGSEVGLSLMKIEKIFELQQKLQVEMANESYHKKESAYQPKPKGPRKRVPIDADRPKHTVQTPAMQLQNQISSLLATLVRSGGNDGDIFAEDAERRRRRAKKKFPGQSR